MRESAFSIYLRTGRKTEWGDRPYRDEVKFNPYHDPENGRFTTAARAGIVSANKQEHSSSANIVNPSSRVLRERRVVAQPGTPTHRLPLRVSQRKNDGRPLPELTPSHNEIRALGAKFPPAKGTEQWTLPKAAVWAAGGSDIHQFKRQWVRGYRDAIKAAARRFDLPAGLVAGTAYNEAGGDPLEIDRAAFTVRDLLGDNGRDRTSFGDVSIQLRRAAEALGYDLNRISSTQREQMIGSLQDPQTGIFVAAKHLSDLRDLDFHGVPGRVLTRDQIEVIATRYNRGSELPKSEIKKNVSYGRAITKRWSLLNQLIR